MKNTLKIESKFLQRVVEVDVYEPENLLGNETVNLLLVNDGQDLAQMGLEEMLLDLTAKRKIEPTLVIGVKAGTDRLLEYGVANKPDFKNRGNKANLYTNFVVQELMPFVLANVKTKVNGKRAFAGFSLGGLTAFDICWHNADLFDTVGVFSGSFWWRKKDLADGYTENDRILHQMLKESTVKPALKFWLMTGTDDEKADRNQNFIIDSIDDTIDVIKELVNKGYKRKEDIFYFEMVGGQHNVESWAKAMPKFLEWAFNK